MSGFFIDDEEEEKKNKKALKKGEEPIIPPVSETEDKIVGLEGKGTSVTKKFSDDSIESLKELEEEGQEDLDFNGLDEWDTVSQESSSTKKTIPKKNEITEKDFELEKIRETIKNPVKLKTDETKTERVITGIQGFDQLVEGGIPKNSLVLLSGVTGTGKSTFAMNFLMEGIKKGEPGAYVTLEESIEETMSQMQQFGWNIDSLIKKRELIITQPELFDFSKLLSHIQDTVSMIGAKRLVIDSLSIMSLYFQDPYRVRRAVLELEKMVKKLDCTTIAISEIPEDSNALSVYGVEEFIADGIIIMYYLKKDNFFSRALTVRKMRATDHSLKIHPIKIQKPEGIIVFPDEELFQNI